MNIIMGASGRVGSAIIDSLTREKVPVRGIVRNPLKADAIKKTGAEVTTADAFNEKALRQAFYGGNTAFVLTPENIHSDDVMGDTKEILANYRKAIENSSIKRVVGLSSVGAQWASGTGNLQASYLLEHAFEGLPIQQIFIRPTYFYSNLLGSLSAVKQNHVLPTFYPEDLSVSMISPQEVGTFVAQVINKPAGDDAIYELEGPCYSYNDIANLLGEWMNIPVKARQIPKADWEETLLQIGFSSDAAKHFIEMAEAVISGKAKAEGKGTTSVTAQIPFKHYIANHSSLLNTF